MTSVADAKGEQRIYRLDEVLAGYNRQVYGNVQSIHEADQEPHVTFTESSRRVAVNVKHCTKSDNMQHIVHTNHDDDYLCQIETLMITHEGRHVNESHNCTTWSSKQTVFSTSGTAGRP